jgi:NADPH:quinone reductase-like Zn-dependent oxidoreductase
VSQLVLTVVGAGDDGIEYQDANPTAGEHEVLVAVEAAPINNSDFLYAAGRYGIQAEPPSLLGSEGVGRVLAAGPGADPALVGRRVVVRTRGTWADQVVAAAVDVVPVPDGVDAHQLAMLPINPATAHRLLTAYVDLKPGDWIGQNLGNSAVGQYAIQLAKLAGVRTLSVVRRPEAADVVRALGGDAVLVDGPDLAEQITDTLGGAPLRLVIDGAGDATLTHLAHALADGGSAVSYASTTRQTPSIPFVDLLFRDLRLRGFWLVNWLRTTPREEVEKTYLKLAELVSANDLHAEVAATYPLARYKEAFAHARRSKRGGKVLFTFPAAG